MKRIFRENWGFAVLCAFSVLALARLELQAVPGHFRIFTGAARALWGGQNPYGSDYGTHVGWYFYSPSCALVVFGPLAWLPEKLGLFVYVAASWTAFVWGVRKFWRAYDGEERLLQWFWAAITAQMVGGILASKLEIAIAGILLGSIARLKETGIRRSASTPWTDAFLLAAILNWKFQPLPVVGLFMLSWILIRRNWKFPAALGGMLAAWYALPYAVLPHALVTESYARWQSTFSQFVGESVLNFESVFAFLHNAFGLSLSFKATQAVSAAIGGAFALFTTAWIFLRAPQSPRERASALAGATLVSVALGTAYMTAFSPLGQNNALILYAPLLLSAFFCLDRAANRKPWIWLLAITAAIMTLAYSDVMPHAAREALRHLSLKPLVCLGLGVAVGWDLWKRPRISPPARVSASPKH